MPLTEEQNNILGSSAQTLLVNAFAGCGKTYTLVEYAKRHSRERFTYLAYNRAIKEEAERKFPSNVRCVTTHGMAFSKFGSRYQHKLGNPKAYHVADAMGIDMVSAGRILEVVSKFIISSDHEIGEKHAKLTGLNNPKNIQVALEYAHAIWKKMQSESDSSIPMPHDGYLKLAQLASFNIRTDCILFDEAQDANAVTADIVLHQPCRKVIVGDRHQAIYGFRGAVNAMQMFQADETHWLSSSFRFGWGVASLASNLLRDWVGETKTLKGAGRHETVWAVDTKSPYTVLARTNAGLFDIAAGLAGGKRPYGFVGGVEGYKMDMILDAYYLWRGDIGKIRDKNLASFHGWAEASAYAEQLDDRELKVLINVVENYGIAIPGLVERIRREAVAGHDNEVIMLSTAHKAKGLEWDSVVLANDFQPLEDRYDVKTKRMTPPPKEEINLLYVAVTRALRAVQLNDAILSWLNSHGHHHLLSTIRRSVPVRNDARDQQASPIVDVPALVAKLANGETHLSSDEAKYILAAIKESSNRPA